MSAFARVKRVVSGGQTGVDRAALDWAIRAGISHGGWCPKGRRAEDGVIPERYALRETESDTYEERTYLNVRDSDGTLILNSGALDGGTLLTTGHCTRLGRPYLVVQLDRENAEAEQEKMGLWLRTRAIAVLNVAGPRESKRPGVYRAALEFLESGNRHST
jgi:hypothetical protein